MAFTAEHEEEEEEEEDRQVSVEPQLCVVSAVTEDVCADLAYTLVPDFL